MAQLCKTCKVELGSTQTDWTRHNITKGICRPCLLKLDSSKNTEILDSIDAPVLLMQEIPRQVLTANKKALALFDKNLEEIEGHRGGQVFDCIHSYTEAGCGKDANCEDCKIKNAIVSTFTTGGPFDAVSTHLEIKKADGTISYAVQVSTEKVGNLALVRIDKYEKAK